MPLSVRTMLVMLLVSFLPFTATFAQTTPPAATVQTDKADYLPGEYVHITGSGWQAGEIVRLEIDHSAVTHGNTVLYATADADGNISNSQFLIQTFHLGESFVLTAIGESSGRTATTTFTDGDSFTVSVSPGSATSSVSQTYTIRITNNTTTMGDASSKKIGSFELVIPAGYSGFPPVFGTRTVSNNTLIAQSLSTNTWAPVHGIDGYSNGYKATVTGGQTVRRIALSATGGSYELQIGDWIEFQVTLTNPTTSTNVAWGPDAIAYAGSQNAALSGNKYQFDGPNSPNNSVTISACSAGLGTPTATTALPVVYGNNVTLNSNSTGTYKWQVLTNGNWTDIAGQTGATYTITLPSVASSGTQYRLASGCSNSSAFGNALAVTVAARPITITAGNQSKTFGDVANLGTTAFSITSGTMVGSQSIASVTLSSTGAPASANAGSYNIVPSAAVAGPATALANYAITYANGSLTVNPAPASISVTDLSKTYNRDAQGATVTTTPAGLAVNVTYNGSATIPTNAGSYNVLAVLNNANYTASNGTGTLVIDPKPLTPSFTAANKDYDGNNTATISGRSLTGIIAPDVVTLGTSGTATFSDAAAATAKTVTATGFALSGAAAANYVLTATTATTSADIAPLAVTVTPTAGQFKIYGSNDPAFSYSASPALIGGDAFSGALARSNGNTVGEYNYNLGTLSAGNNYSLTLGGSNKFEIRKKPASVTPNAAGKTYGQDDPDFTGTLSGFLPADNVQATYSRTTGEGAGGAYTISASLTPAGVLGNYDITYNTAAFTIGKATATLTLGNLSHTYDGTVKSATASTTPTGLAGVTVTGSGTSAGSYPVSASLDNPNYEAAPVNGSLVIGKANTTTTVTITGAPFTYTGSAITPATVSVTGPGGLNLTPAAAYSNNINAGTATASYNFAGDNNYHPSNASENFTIGARPVTVTADAKSKTYGDADPALTYQITSGSLVNGHTFTGSLSRAAGEGAGSYAINQGNLALNANYNLSFVSDNLTIGKATLTVTAQNASKFYGEGVPGFSYQMTGFQFGQNPITGGVSGAPSITTTATTSSPVGTYPITPALGTLSAANYTFAFVNAVLTVNKGEVHVTAANKTKVYGQPNPALTVDYSGFVLGQDESVLDGTLSVVTTATTASPVGNYSITPSGLTSSNYHVVFHVGELEVTKAPLLVTADNKSKVYGQANPTFTASYSGFVNGDNASNLGGTLSFNTPATASSPVGNYTIAPSGLTSNNYTVSFANGNLAVTKADLIVTATSPSKVYDNQVFTGFGVTYSGFVNGDQASALGGTLSYSGPATTAVNVGAHSVTPGGLTSGNYSIAFANGTLTIESRPITITANPRSKTYGDADPSLTHAITSGSLAAGDAITGSLSRLPGEDVGTYAINQGTLAINNNYNLTYVPANLTIGTRPVTVTADAKSKTYGQADPALTYQITSGSLVNGDLFMGALSRATGENVGNYAIGQHTLTLNANYALSFVSANLSITARPITITADAKNKVYGNSDPMLTYQITSGTLAFTDAVTGDLTREAGDNVGSYQIQKGSVAINDNYNLTYVPANLTIGQRPITITAGNQSKTYGDNHNLGTTAFSITSGTMAGSETIASVALNSTGAAAAANAGTYPIVPSAAVGTAGTLVGNYNISYANGTLTVDKKNLIVTAEDKSKVYGDANPALTVVYNGFVNGQSASALTTQPTATTTATAASGVGSYDIVPAGGVSNNYSFTYVNGTLSIGTRAVTVKANSRTKVYGNTDPALTYGITVGNLVNGDAFSGSLTRDAGEHVGSYAITQGTLALSNNYVLSFVGDNLSITARPITVTADAKSKIYGQADPALTYQITSGSLAFADAFAGSLTRVSGEQVGPYAIQQGTLALTSNYTLTYVPANLTIHIAPITTSVVSTLPSVQYSDLTTLVARINNGAPKVDGQAGAAASATFRIGTQVMGTANFEVDGDNLVATLANVKLVEIAPGNGQMAPGAKNVTATFNTPSANYGLTTANNSVVNANTLSITREDAAVTYTGMEYIALPTTTATSVNVTMSATIRDLYAGSDANRGNIKNARVTFRRDSPNGALLGTASLNVSPVTDSTVGVASTSFTYSLNQTEQSAGGANLVVYTVVEGYYQNQSDLAMDPVSVQIVRPGGEFVTGGGWLLNQTTAGTLGAGTGLKTNFGFNMQYTRSGTNLKGQCNIIVRGSNGKIYQIKSNAVNTLLVGINNTTNSPHATFNTKANLTDITNPLAPISLGGNLDLTVRMNDVSNGGQGDQLAIVLQNTNTSELIFSSNWNGTNTILQNLGGGNVNVRTTSSTITTPGQASRVSPEIVGAFAERKLEAVASPNPSTSVFTLKLDGGKEPISLRVVDQFGRVVEGRNNLFAGQAIQIGAGYKVGTYIVELIQGGEKKVVRIVKM